MTTNLYISPSHASLLTRNHFASFDALWSYQGDWFEAPNTERGGLSGVNYIELADESGKLHGFYLKRQHGHSRRTWRHPIKGEATFAREFTVLRHLSASGTQAVKTPTVVFFATQDDKAILLTAALTGYISADKWFEKNNGESLNRKKKLIEALAKTVRNLHQAGVWHRSLYTKHLFVKEVSNVDDSQFDVAVIDFEKSRITPLVCWFRFADLITLHYRTPEMSRACKLYFLKSYLAVSQLNKWHKILCCYINHVSSKKSQK